MDLYKFYSPEDMAEQINLEFTEHSKRRAKQRSIPMDLIQLAMLYSSTFFKQGRLFYVVKNSDLPESFDKRQKNELKNIVVIVSGENNKIITCYRNKNAMHNIKKKSKRLAKNRYAA